MKLKKLTLPTLLFSLFLCFSCAHQNPVRQQEKKYSQDVENEFSNIENDQQRVLNYYRTLRQKNWEDYKNGGSQKTQRPQRRTYKTYSPPRSRPSARPRKTVTKVAPEKPALSQEQVEEINIEIQQNLDYFCMKNRKSSRFNSQSQCQSYARNIFEKCKNTVTTVSLFRM